MYVLSSRGDVTIKIELDVWQSKKKKTRVKEKEDNDDSARLRLQSYLRGKNGFAEAHKNYSPDIQI